MRNLTKVSVRTIEGACWYTLRSTGCGLKTGFQIDNREDANNDNNNANNDNTNANNDNNNAINLMIRTKKYKGAICKTKTF